MGSYWDDVTVYPYDGDIGGTNPVVRHVMSLTCTLKRKRNLLPVYCTYQYIN